MQNEMKRRKNKTSQDEATETSSMTDKEKAKNAKKTSAIRWMNHPSCYQLS